MQPNIIKTHRFRGKRYSIRLGARLPADRRGDADAPRIPGRMIRIRNGMDGLTMLDTLIHEGLHACSWDMADEAVHETASDIARFLWRLGYRTDQGQ